MDKFRVERRTWRNQQFNSNRGLWFCGEELFYGGKKRNLGNDLRMFSFNQDIAEGLFKCLDKDKDQHYPPITSSLLWIKPPPPASACAISLPLVATALYTVTGSKGLEDPFLADKFDKANGLVKQIFANRGISADLSQVIEQGFSVDLCVMQSFRQFDPQTPVLGACMFVFMKVFSWVMLGVFVG